MGVPNQNQNQTQNPSSTHFYPQELQLKLYQAFIFSVPILFSIILLLLFYLFYLKRTRESSNHPSSLPSTTVNSTPRMNTTMNNQPTSILPFMTIDVSLIKEELKEKLPIVTFDENLRDKDSLCCVCLGDFELSEQLHQIPSCKHVFHVECIHHWLRTNSTCPLCRCFILPVKKADPAVEPPLPPV
ncbi:hypothetical protein MKW94_027122 [Papaver nudicaule]|uniref:RING-type E3 ubiquitin transferase n=1 Tax=Papaver nudicaule TaxID=74823 RepID=A0AA41S4D3_PAPNU|nr:hypothetical protein [Papaver nudicaule]MCL7026963.1 hypothetical protein [Papaver nudicaule]